MESYSIATFSTPSEGGRKLPIEEVRQVFNNDVEIQWFEDVDNNFKESQSKLESPNFKKSGVYKYENGKYEMELYYRDYIGTIGCKIWAKDTEGSLKKIKEIASKLECNVYRGRKLIFKFNN